MKLKSIKNKVLSVGIAAVMLISTSMTSMAFGAIYNESDTRIDSKRVAEQIQEEGTVLLKNDNDALPLAPNSKVNFFGVPSITPVLDGGGSGAIRFAEDLYEEMLVSGNIWNPSQYLVTQMYDQLEKYGIEANQELRDFYREWFLLNNNDNAYTTTVTRTSDDGNVFGVASSVKAEPPFEQLLNPDLGLRNVVKERNAQNVLLPVFDENGDLIYEDTYKGSYEKDYSNLWDNAVEYSDTAIIYIGRIGSESADLQDFELRLRKAEKDLIKACGEAFDKTIVVFNTCNVMEMGELEDPEYGVDAAMMIWASGEFGHAAVADMLAGERNPSGKLASTITYEVDAHPSTANFGNYRYTNGSSSTSSNTFLQYEEGIYVGYRYFETFEQTDKVQYPFGYGLSYTTFNQEILGDIQDHGDYLTLDVQVTNTGSMAGKEVVEVYMTPPYYTRSNIEKAKNVLVGFEKTSMLQPGASETVTVTIDKYDMASYDMNHSECYVVEAGQYQFNVMTSLRSNTITDPYVGDTLLYDVSSDIEFKEDPVTGYGVQNRFEDAINGGADGTPITVLSRADHDATYPTAPEGDDFIQSSYLQSLINVYPEPQTEGEAFAFGITRANPIMLEDIYKDAVLQVNIGNYDNLDDAIWESELWDDFIHQITAEEVFALIARGGYQTHGFPNYGIPATSDNDGPQQVKASGLTTSAPAGTAYPIASCVACTWNIDLAEEMGIQVGRDAAVIGVHSWYAPGNNLHRSPMGGRNFEYYSEDPFLAGEVCGNVIAGAREEGLTVTVKHFALNDCEQNRGGVMTFADEQTIREIYLKAFEKSIKIGGARGVMTSFNRIGATWAGAHNELLTEVLRNEWGFRGYVVTDYLSAYNYMIPALAIYAQNDTMLAPSYNNGITNLRNTYASDPIGLSHAMARSVKNLCYFKLNTFAFETPAEADPLYMSMIQDAYNDLLAVQNSAEYANMPSRVQAAFDQDLENIYLAANQPYLNAEEIAQALAWVGEAYSLLGIQVGDPAVLSALVDIYEEINLSLYREQGQDAFLAAMEKARGVLAGEPLDDEIAAMVVELTTARNALRLKSSTEALEYALGRAQAIDLVLFTAESIEESNIVPLMARAAMLLADPEAEQDEIDDMVDALYNAMDILILNDEVKDTDGNDTDGEDPEDSDKKPEDTKEKPDDTKENPEDTKETPKDTKEKADDTKGAGGSNGKDNDTTGGKSINGTSTSGKSQVKTGDETNIWMIILLAGAVVGSLGIVFVSMKRKVR